MSDLAAVCLPPGAGELPGDVRGNGVCGARRRGPGAPGQGHGAGLAAAGAADLADPPPAVQPQPGRRPHARPRAPHPPLQSGQLPATGVWGEIGWMGGGGCFSNEVGWVLLLLLLFCFGGGGGGEDLSLF